jgi:hypothetical protein
MAKQQHGINDGYRGSVGTVIGYQWRDVWCLRSRPVRVRNPRTPQQQAGRSVFGIVSSLAAGFSTALRLGLQQESRRQGMTARNLFVRLNRPAVTLTDDGVEVDYPSFAVAAGPVAPVAFDAAAVDGLSVVVPFDRNPLHLRTDSADEVYLFAWCPEAGAGVLSQPVFRRCREVRVDLPANWAGLEFHLYGFVVDYAGRASVSSYIAVNQHDSNLHKTFKYQNNNKIQGLSTECHSNDSDFNTENRQNAPVLTWNSTCSEKNIVHYSIDNQSKEKKSEIFLKKYLVGSEKDCTFAPVFVKKTREH